MKDPDPHLHNFNDPDSDPDHWLMVPVCYEKYIYTCRSIGNRTDIAQVPVPIIFREQKILAAFRYFVGKSHQTNIS
jgi:hypothetical protein